MKNRSQARNGFRVLLCVSVLASTAGAQRVLLDNFSLPNLNTAVRQYRGRIELEASGGVDLQSVRAIADTGVDFISTGAITKSVTATDFSMRFVEP